MSGDDVCHAEALRPETVLEPLPPMATIPGNCWECNDHRWSLLHWPGLPLDYPGLIRIPVLADGSCFFHTLCRSYHAAYLDMTNEDRGRFVRDLRHDLAIHLGQHRSDDKTWYQSLSRGALSSFAEVVPEYSLEAMQNELRYGGAVDNVYNEYVSDILDKDLHLVDALIGDVYVTGDDDDILYKNRPSIVILVWPGHYELLGVHEPTRRAVTLFEPTHPFIELLHQRRRYRRSHPRPSYGAPPLPDATPTLLADQLPVQAVGYDLQHILQ